MTNQLPPEVRERLLVHAAITFAWTTGKNGSEYPEKIAEELETKISQELQAERERIIDDLREAISQSSELAKHRLSDDDRLELSIELERILALTERKE